MHRLLQTIMVILKRIWKDLWQAKLLLLGLAMYWLFARYVLHAFCPMVILTGLPCPGCGLTRALLSLLRGDFVAAFYYNPTIFCWVGFAGVWAFYRYGLGRKMPKLNLVAAIVSVITIGVYLYRMAFFFPSHAPLTYQYRNVFSHLFPFYDSLLKNIWKI